MKVTITPQKIFEVKAPDGTTWTMTQFGDSWNGLIELRTDDHQSLIVCPVTSPITSAFNAIMGDGSAEYYVVKGSPNIIAALN
jgi:hypothetical protein